MHMNPIIIIPARMASTRLPEKPLAIIGGLPMIVQVWKRAVAAGLGEVVVACDSKKIASVIEAAGGRAILTDPDLPSGSDRIYAALCEIDPEMKHDVVINVQGDMPTLDPSIILSAARLLENEAVDIGTLAAVIRSGGELADSAVVKVALTAQPMTADRGQMTSEELSSVIRHLSSIAHRAIYFSRAPIPHGASAHYHHIGIYAYRREALERFVKLPPSPLELAEKLEQLRALEAGMRIDVAVVDTVPLGVDTAEGLGRARKIIDDQRGKNL
jgi:3-deoxy-manno-octulosonate cytidylyltransferase (CMP-KDO synthetase)